jgi:hypothetical protein
MRARGFRGFELLLVDVSAEDLRLREHRTGKLQAHHADAAEADDQD